MSSQLDALGVQVARIKTVAASAVTLIKGLAAEVIRLKDDPAALQAFADDLNAEATTLGDTVVENTPAAPTP